MTTTEHRKNAEKAIAASKAGGTQSNERATLLVTAQVNLLRSIDDNLTVLVSVLKGASSSPRQALWVVSEE